MILASGTAAVACAGSVDANRDRRDALAFAVEVFVTPLDEGATADAADTSAREIADASVARDAMPLDVREDDATDAYWPDTMLDGTPRCEGGTCPVLREIGVGGGHSCVLHGDGRVACWGANFSGQIGIGEVSPSAPPQLNPYLADVVHVSAGGRHTCALLRDGTVSCWGANDNGQSAVSVAGVIYSPRRVVGIDSVVQIIAGWSHSCALRRDGRVLCWGSNTDGEHGFPAAGRAVPVVPLPEPANRLFKTGYEATCALLGSGGVWCWGRNTEGQLGTGVTAMVSPPTAVLGLRNPRAFEMGNMHSCAIDARGVVLCWGSNRFSSLGNPPGNSALPRAVSDVTGATSLSVGGYHTCVGQTGRDAVCWGDSWSASPGPTTPAWGAVPTALAGTATADAMFSGHRLLCILTNGFREVMCMGDPGFGSLGGTPAPGDAWVHVPLPP